MCTLTLSERLQTILSNKPGKKELDKFLFRFKVAYSSLSIISCVAFGFMISFDKFFLSYWTIHLGGLLLVYWYFVRVLKEQKIRIIKIKRLHRELEIVKCAMEYMRDPKSKNAKGFAYAFCKNRSKHSLLLICVSVTRLSWEMIKYEAALKDLEESLEKATRTFNSAYLEATLSGDFSPMQALTKKIQEVEVRLKEKQNE